MRSSAEVGSPGSTARQHGSQEKEWDIISAGNGFFNLKNRLSGMVLDLNSSGFAVQQSQSASSQTQQWQIVPVH